jgi:preprotein translocase subunit SecY
MASATEQLARQFNWGTFGKAKDLKARLLFTLGALIVFRLGTHIPLPGVDPQILAEIFAQKSTGTGILGMFDMFSGGALQRMAIFALNIMPYISASIIVQLMGSVIPAMEQLKKEGEIGRKKMNQYTRYLTVVLAAIQGYGISVGLENMTGAHGSAVIDPGMLFRMTSVVTLVGGTVFLMWLGEQITARGIGNGTSLIIFAGIVARLPTAVAQTLALGREGAIATPVILLVMVLAVAIIAFIVFMERAQRRILVQYPKRQVGQKIYGGESTHLPLKLNTSGVIPPIFASSLLLLPVTIVNFAGNSGSGFLSNIARYIQHGQPLYMALYGGLIVFFCFFYTALVFNPTETAENLRKAGGFIPGMKPGKNTADYLDYVLTRITVIGAAYITLICLLPEFLIAKFSIPFYFGGTSLLIAVTVTMDTVAQVHSYLLAHQYEGLLNKRRTKGARKK